METTVEKIKIGSKLILGQYGVRSEATSPIMWLKATPNGDFITAQVLDYISFDARERASADYTMKMYGNPDYERSNILLFLNSEDSDWWHRTHPSDAPPTAQDVQSVRGAYHEHVGFLYNFEDYETDSISAVRLPSCDDFIGPNKFQLFWRKGIRAHGTADYIDQKGMYVGFSDGSYVDFWMSDRYSENYVYTLNRNGEKRAKLPYNTSGLRPVCTIKPETVLEADENGIYRLKPVNVQNSLFTDEEFFSLLGIARP